MTIVDQAKFGSTTLGDHLITHDTTEKGNRTLDINTSEDAYNNSFAARNLSVNQTTLHDSS